jgi:hypothetical protein
MLSKTSQKHGNTWIINLLNQKLGTMLFFGIWAISVIFFVFFRTCLRRGPVQDEPMGKKATVCVVSSTFDCNVPSDLIKNVVI